MRHRSRKAERSEFSSTRNAYHDTNFVTAPELARISFMERSANVAKGRVRLSVTQSNRAMCPLVPGQLELDSGQTMHSPQQLRASVRKVFLEFPEAMHSSTFSEFIRAALSRFPDALFVMVLFALPIWGESAQALVRRATCGTSFSISLSRVRDESVLGGPSLPRLAHLSPTRLPLVATLGLKMDSPQ
jgi:hypothetical protein